MKQTETHIDKISRLTAKIRLIQKEIDELNKQHQIEKAIALKKRIETMTEVERFYYFNDMTEEQFYGNEVYEKNHLDLRDHTTYLLLESITEIPKDWEPHENTYMIDLRSMTIKPRFKGFFLVVNIF